MRSALVLLLICLVVGASAQGVAVIELFTSQGCSSCPAADRNLTQILQLAEKNGTQVYGLSFHVDYWNYIGWKDPYSSKEFTARQSDYWKELGFQSVYTPQMIVNGEVEFVGSDKSAAELSIEKALHQSALYSFTTLNATVKNDVVSISYSFDKVPIDEVLNIALVEKKAENLVSAGENNGKRLSHDNVVRVFRTLRVHQRDTIELKFAGINLSKTVLIAYVQNKKRKVVAASATPVK